jgi:hypothetical protein
MGQIFVEGLGTVEIQGDTPSENETKQIGLALDQIKENKFQPDSEKVADSFLSGPGIARLGLELGLSIAGTVATGGLALPALALRGGMLARPFLTKLAQSSLGSAVGGGTGAGLAQTFDPKDDIVREILRGGIEGAVGEAIGAPVVIKGGQLISKTFNKAPTAKEFLKPLTDAQEAEEILFTVGKKGIPSQADKILANPEKYTDKFYDVDKVLDMAKEAKKGLTIGMKTESRFLDTLENIATKSFFGAEELIGRKEALAFVGQAAQKDFIENATQGLNKTDLGTLFFDSITGAKNARKAYFNAQYKSLDDIVKKELGLRADQAPPKLITGKPIIDSLNTYIKDLQLPSKDVLALQKDMLKRIAGKRFDFKSLETLRSEIGIDANDAFRAGNSKLGKAYSNMQKSIDDLLDNKDALKKFQIPETAVNKIKQIRKEYADTSELFEDGIFANILAKGNKDGGVDEIFNAIIKGKQKSTLVQVTKDKIEESVKRKFLTEEQGLQLKDSLKGQYLQNIFERSKLGKSKDGAAPIYSEFVDASSINKNLNADKQTYDILFDTNEKNTLDKLIKNLAISQGTLDKKTGLPGGVFIQLKQAGALGSLLSYGSAGNLAGLLADKGIATILIAPAVFSKIMLNPKFNKLIFEETAKQNLRKTSPTKAGVAFRNIVGRLVDEGLIDSEEGLRAIEESKQVQADFERKGIKNTDDFNKAAAAPQQRPAPTMPPVNTRVTDIQTRPVSQPMPMPQGTMPAGGLRERIAQSNQLDQFIPVR